MTPETRAPALEQQIAGIIEGCLGAWHNWHVDEDTWRESVERAASQIAALAPQEPEPRKPVGVSFQPDTEHSQGGLLVLCDDGSLWDWNGAKGWTEFSPIPGTRRAQEVEHATV